MKKLTGSKKQIAWANEIREKAITDLNKLIKKQTERDGKYSRQLCMAYKAALEVCGEISEARTWIDLDMKRKLSNDRDLSLILWKRFLEKEFDKGKITAAELNESGLLIGHLPETVLNLLKSKYE